MAAAHAKIYSDKKEYVLRISDCHNTIKLWGKIDSEEDLIEGIEKLENLTTLAAELKQVLEGKLTSIEKKSQVPTKITVIVKSLLEEADKNLIAAKNKVTPSTISFWIDTNNPEILKPYNINLISELLNIAPHEVWE